MIPAHAADVVDEDEHRVPPGEGAKAKATDLGGPTGGGMAIGSAGFAPPFSVVRRKYTNSSVSPTIGVALRRNLNADPRTRPPPPAILPRAGPGEDHEAAEHPQPQGPLAPERAHGRQRRRRPATGIAKGRPVEGWDRCGLYALCLPKAEH